MLEKLKRIATEQADELSKLAEKPSEMSLDLNDGRTSRLERWIVWAVVLTTVVGSLVGVVNDVWQMFK